jgi:hypothetical protein
MPVFYGNTSGSVASVAKNISCKIVSYTLVNRHGSNITLSVTIIPDGGTPVQVWAGTLSSGAAHESTTEIILLKGFQILVITNGSLDYYFSYE